MTKKSKNQVNLFAVAIITLLLSGVAYSQDVIVDEDASRVTPSQRLQLYRLNQELKARSNAATKNDPRYASYLADFERLRKQSRARFSRESIAAFRKKYADFQNDILQRSGIDRRAYNLRLKKILPHVRLNSAGDIINARPTRNADNMPRSSSGFANATFLPIAFSSFQYALQDDSFDTSDFSKKWAYQDCSQASVNFDSSREFSVFANTSMSEDDCDDVRGAGGTVIDVPAGVKRVRVEITLDRYQLMTDVATPLLFSYGNSYAAVGIRVKGWIFGSVKQTNYFRHKYLDTVWSVMGGDFADVEESGEVILKCSFRPLVPGEYRIQAYGRAWATTDGLAISSGFVAVEGLQKIKVTFVR